MPRRISHQSQLVGNCPLNEQPTVEAGVQNEPHWPPAVNGGQDNDAARRPE
jgi:hypothetical protein